MKMEQKIDAGGSSKTKTPILKFLMNLPLFELDSTALHIEHCAFASKLKSNTTATAKIKSRNVGLKNFITAPQLVPAQPAPSPETYNGVLMTGSYPEKIQTTGKYKSPTSAPA